MATFLKFFLVTSFILIVFVSSTIADDKVKDKKQAVEDVSDLPLKIFESTSPKRNYFVIAFSGDGGWRGVIDYIAKGISYTHHNVVGFSALPYFYTERTAESVAKDLEKVIKKYSAQWKTDSILILGYSFTAEIMPFVYNHLDKEYKSRIKKILMLGPSNFADFRASRIFHYDTTAGMKVLPEMKKITPSMFVIYCDIYKESICYDLPNNHPYKVIKVDSHHLFLGHYKDITNIIIRTLSEIDLEKN
jgi:type IV secretory pathway VirJ component